MHAVMRVRRGWPRGSERELGHDCTSAIEVSGTAQQGGERVSEREHERVGREKEGGYSETARRAPKRGREEQQRKEFQVVHIAPAKRRLMERLEGMPRGDG